MTTTTHTITLEVDWNEDGTYPRNSLKPHGCTDRGQPASDDYLAAALGIYRPKPFVPPFKVGDIITCGNATVRIVAAINDSGATLAYPADRGYAATMPWAALTADWRKIGTET